MIDPQQLITFSIAAYILIIVPGPAMLYVIARSIEQGRLAGLASVAGVAVGSLVHTAAAALGLSAILATSALAFSIVKYAGAAYLIYLGIKTLRSRDSSAIVTESISHDSNWHIFKQGVVVNVLNPKAALFFLAFLPQFTNPANGSVALQIMLLGFVFFLIALLSDGMYAMLAGSLASLLKRNPTFERRKRLLSGTSYILLGVTAAITSGDSQ